MSSQTTGAHKDDRKQIGRWGEDLAARLLESKGYKVLDRNWRTRQGEIDIIAQEGETIAFVEVKTRRGREFGLPEEGLTSAKANRLTGLAKAYIQQHDLHDLDWRIDLVAIELDHQSVLLRCDHIPNAVLGW